MVVILWVAVWPKEWVLGQAITIYEKGSTRRKMQQLTSSFCHQISKSKIQKQNISGKHPNIFNTVVLKFRFTAHSSVFGMRWS